MTRATLGAVAIVGFVLLALTALLVLTGPG
jgi:hypothetical protein